MNSKQRRNEHRLGLSLKQYKKLSKVSRRRKRKQKIVDQVIEAFREHENKDSGVFFTQGGNTYMRLGDYEK